MRGRRVVAAGLGALALFAGVVSQRVGSVAAELSPAGTTVRIEGNDWVRMEIPGVSGHLIKAATCLTLSDCWVTTDATLRRTRDGGLTWAPPIKLEAKGFVMATTQRGFTNTQVTEDGGNSWSPFLLEGSAAQFVHFVRRDLGYACTSQAKTYRTTDSGQTWSRVADHCPDATEGAALLDENISWRGQSGYSNRLLYSADHGATTTPVPVASVGEDVYPPVFWGYTDGWAVAYEGRYGGSATFTFWGQSNLGVYRTQDGGANWSKTVSLPDRYTDLLSLRFASPTIGWMTLATQSPLGTSLLRTADAGSTWKEELWMPLTAGQPSLGAANLDTEIGALPVVYGLAKSAVGRATLAEGYPAVVFRRAPSAALSWPTATPTPRSSFTPVIPGATAVGTPIAAAPPAVPAPGRAGVTATPGPAATTSGGRDTIRAAYLAILAREPEPAGLNFWVNSGQDVTALIGQIGGSGEGNRVLRIRNAFVELLGRDPLGSDMVALRRWYDSPLTIDDIRAALADTDEYRARQVSQ